MRSSLGHGGDLAGTLRAERYIHTQSGDGSRMSRGTFFISVWMPYAWRGAIFHFSQSFSKEIYNTKSLLLASLFTNRFQRGKEQGAVKVTG